MFGFSYPGQTYSAGYPLVIGVAVEVEHRLSERTAHVPAERTRLALRSEDRAPRVRQERRNASVPGERRRLTVNPEDRRRSR